MRCAVAAISLELMLLTSGATHAAAIDAPASPAPAAGISEIVLVRTDCLGPCPVDELVLRADGTAEYSGMRNTPLTGHFTGSIDTRDFGRLASMLSADGFFDLDASYGHRNIDAAHDVITIVRNGMRTSITNYGRDQSIRVWAMEKMVRGTAADIRWQPAASGIRGIASWKPRGGEWSPWSNVRVWAESARGGMKFLTMSGANGEFEIPLAPGTYVLSVESVHARSPGAPDVTLSFSIPHNGFTDVTLKSDRESGELTLLGLSPLQPRPAR